jgi:RNA polymerase sigma-70 factor (ECF subfamily)
MKSTCYPQSALADMDDLSLVRRAQSGDHAAFGILVIRYRRRILELTMRYVRNPCDAEDAAQETFIKVYRGLRQFRGDSAFYTWLHRIAINSAKNVLLARRRDPLLTSLDSEGSDTEHHPRRMMELETPEDIALSDDICHAVGAALAQLPESHRLAITLREIDGFTYKQIAAAMASPIGTVRSRVFRARELIDQQLRRVYPGGLGRHDRRRSGTSPDNITCGI